MNTPADLHPFDQLGSLLDSAAQYRRSLPGWRFMNLWPRFWRPALLDSGRWHTLLDSGRWHTLRTKQEIRDAVAKQWNDFQSLFDLEAGR